MGVHVGGAASWDRMMAGFTQRNVARRASSAGRGNRIGSFAARYNIARSAGISRQIGAQQESAKQANLQRYEQMMDIYNQVIARAQPGGAFEKAGLQQIGAAKIKGVGQETQSLISGGMFGTTTAAGVGRKWEADVGAPARLRLEDIMEQRRTTAQLGKAGAIERREDVYPDVGAYAQYAAQAAPAPTRRRKPQPSLASFMQSFQTGGLSGRSYRSPGSFA